MLFADPLKRVAGLPKDAVIFSGGGKFFQHFENECFVLADGVPGTKHADTAAQLAIETAMWGYKLVRQRHSYWLNRDAFLKRIFRSTNITLWQKHREVGFEAGLSASLLVCMFRGTHYWIGSTGTISSFLLRDGAFTSLTKEDADSQGRVTKMVGKDRFGLIPQIVYGPFRINDTLLLAPKSVTQAIPVSKMQEILESAGTTTDSLSKTVSDQLVNAVVIKRVKI